MKISVIGGANVDIHTTPLQKYVDRDSNPSRVYLEDGGVGRNIAHNLALLGADVQLATLFGNDMPGERLKKTCREAGIGLSLSETIADGRTCMFVCINDDDGEMAAAASDMEIVNRLTPEWLEPRMPLINQSDAIVADTNLPETTLTYLLNHARRPLFIDCVSVPKARKMREALEHGLYSSHTIIKVNRHEAGELSGMTVGSDNLREAAEWFIAHGAAEVYITLGAGGTYCHNGRCPMHIPTKEIPAVNATGAGDAFLAATIFSRLSGGTTEQSIAFGHQAAALALQTLSPVNPEMRHLKPALNIQ